LTGPFRVRLWCRDCTGQDSQGCFDGDAILLEDDSPPYDTATYTTLRAAVDAGHSAAPSGPLEFDVLDANGEEIEYRRMTAAEIDHFVSGAASLQETGAPR
jgi:hypothetical protein